MRQVVRFLLRYSRASTLAAIGLGLISGACASAVVALVTQAISETDPEQKQIQLLTFIAVGIALPITAVLTQYLLGRTNQRAVLALRRELVRRLLDLPLRQLENLGANRLITFLTQDISSISGSIVMMSTLLINSTFVIGMLAYLIWISWQGFLVMLGVILLVMITQRIPSRAVSRLLRKVRVVSDELYDQFRALIFGNKELKVHQDRRQAFYADFDQTAKALCDGNVRAVTLMMVASSWYRLLILSLVGVLVFGPFDLLQFDSEKMTLFILIVFVVGNLVQQFNNNATSITTAGVALDKLGDLGFSLEVTQPAAALSAPALSSAALSSAALSSEDAPRREVPPWRRIELCGVTHAYRREDRPEVENFSIGPIDLTFEPGQLVILAGGNGSGKTTLAKLLVGLYAPESGVIRVDGQEIGEAERDAYRQHFSVVFSDFFLFDRLLGFDATQVDEHAQQYLHKLQLDHKLDIQQGVFSTTDLSQGQRKRLALLTSYIEDRSFYVFDEWAADQDPLFKRFFYEELLPELKQRGKMVLAISHDDHYYHVADRIIRLDYGKVEAIEEAGETG